MYTLGTSQIRWIAQQQSLPILDNKLVAFVGTSADRTATDPAIGMNQFTVFFDITQAPTTVTIYSTVQVNGQWQWDVDNTAVITDPTLLLQNLKTASGWTQTIIAVQRGDTAGMNAALRSDGVFYYDKQAHNLYIYDGSLASWVPIIDRSADISVAVGVILGWPNSVAIPLGYLRCDGHSYAIADYPMLFSAIGYTYGGSGLYFSVPTIDNSIILAQM